MLTYPTGYIMKKAISYGLIAAVLLGGAFWACSDKKEPAP